MLLRNVRLHHDGQESVDVLVCGECIAEVGPNIGTNRRVVAEDCEGALVLPGLVDSHCHVDKTLWGGPWVPHSAASDRADRIENERRRRAEFGLPRRDYAAALLGTMVAHGTTYVRSHTDVDPAVGLAGIQVVREAADQHVGRITVEQVAFPQGGVVSRPGTLELLEEALKSGVETIGGIDPASRDRDPVAQLDAIFNLAERYGAKIDIHLHDGGSLGAWEFELIIERTKATGLRGRVTISHAFGICDVPEVLQDRLIEGLADNDISLATAAVYDRPVPPIKKLRAAGINVACGNDGVRDLWGAYGNGDMLERAMIVAYRSGFRRDEEIALALDAATFGGARAMGLKSYGLRAGSKADLVVVPARNTAEAVVARPLRKIVMKSGRIVARDGLLV